MEKERIMEKYTGILILNLRFRPIKTRENGPNHIEFVPELPLDLFPDSNRSSLC